MEDGRSAREFSVVLREAIQESGLTLESLRSRLAQRGLRVSVATLSYWQRGRSRPERADSLTAVAALEQILGLASGALTDLLKARRPRGQPGGGAARQGRLWSDPRPIPQPLAELDRSCEHRLEWLSVHDVVGIDAARRPRSLSVRKVLRASGDNADRVLAAHQVGEERPELSAVRYCRRGRIRHDPDSGVLAFELFFERVLNRGETAVVEYELRFPERPAISRSYDRRFRNPVHEYLCIVQFHHDEIPARCYRNRRETFDAAPGDTVELWLGPSRSVHSVGADVDGGIIGVEWEWE